MKNHLNSFSSFINENKNEEIEKTAMYKKIMAGVQSRNIAKFLDVIIEVGKTDLIESRKIFSYLKKEASREDAEFIKEVTNIYVKIYVHLKK
jgi:hypothetical protein